jgi:DNA-binding NarL/FixJ family response regulator
MTEQRIILANGSRLLRDLLKRVFIKSEHLAVVREVTDQKELPSAIEHSNPAWVVVSLAYDNGIPSWVDGFLAIHPSVRFLAVASDGSKVKMKWLEIHEQELNGLSLSELLRILENKPVNP